MVEMSAINTIKIIKKKSKKIGIIISPLGEIPQNIDVKIKKIPFYCNCTCTLPN